MIFRRGESRTFERGLRRVISVGGGACAVHEAELERGRTRGRTETSVYSGPPPAEWSARLELPPRSTSGSAARELLASLVAPWRGRARLHYSSWSGRRVTVNDVAEGPVREVDVWAVTGWISGPGPGPRLPIGWSGRGDGLAWLRAHAADALRAQGDAIGRAAPIEPGTPPAVLAPAAAAVLLHEAVGHSAEAPLSPGSPHFGRLGHRIASELVSIVDDPLCDGGPARYEYDDDNVRVLGPTTLMRDGVVTGHLHSGDSARTCETLPTGNARAASAWDPPIPRMSNLICAPGQASEDQLLCDVGAGLYIHRLSDGISGTGKIEARIVLAECIRDGARTGRLFSGGRIEEDVAVLCRVVGVADNAAFSPNAMCGRAGQLLFDVGTSAPSLQFSALRITT